MGSNGPLHPPHPPASSGPEEDEEIIVVVTGFSPFKPQYPINPSWSVASSLPPFIPLLSPTSSSTTPAPSTSSVPSKPHPPPRSTRIRILVHPSPIRVSYSAVRALVPSLWRTSTSTSCRSSTASATATPSSLAFNSASTTTPIAASASSPPRRIDFMIHVGMAGGRDFYSVERRAHRRGYVMADVDGVVLGDEEGEEGEDREGEDGGQKKWIWEGCPEELETGCDVDDVWRRWSGSLPETDIRISEDAGHYLCDFIYYSSLAELWKRGEERRVVFFHVPVDSDRDSVATGREVLIELIRALVQSREMSGSSGLAVRQQRTEKQKNRVT